MKGKTILMYPADGEPTGILLAEISNWTGKVLVAPRSQLDQLSKREEVRRTGVYLLVGSDPDDPSRQLVYVGESDIEESIIGSPVPRPLLVRSSTFDDCVKSGVNGANRDSHTPNIRELAGPLLIIPGE